jgi:NADPH:quinone reductase-like Zn-dependent oxidoreductase
MMSERSSTRVLGAVVESLTEPTVSIRFIDVPSPVDAALVRVCAAGINPVDAGSVHDGTWAGVRAPYIVGFDFCRYVEQAPAASRFQPGDRVWGALPVRGTRFGAHASHVVVTEAALALAPPSIADLEAGALPLVGLTAHQALTSAASWCSTWRVWHDRRRHEGSNRIPADD